MKKTLKPHEYFFKAPKDIAERECLVVDPMLATGGSANDAIAALKKRGVKDIKLAVLVAAPEGTKAVQEENPDVDIYGASEEVINCWTMVTFSLVWEMPVTDSSVLSKHLFTKNIYSNALSFYTKKIFGVKMIYVFEFYSTREGRSRSNGEIICF